MPNMRSITYGDVAARLVALGMVSQEKARHVLARRSGAADEELGSGRLAAALVDFGVAVAAHRDDGDGLEGAYRAFLQDAAACTGGLVVVGGVRLAEGEDGAESLEFVRNGEPISWHVEHQSEDRLDQLAILEVINMLDPGDGGDTRTFHSVPVRGPGEGGAFVLATPEQAAALQEELGLELE